MTGKGYPKELERAFGLPCCRVEIGEFDYLSMGFGLRIPNANPRLPRFYGQYEMGAYSAAWSVSDSGGGRWRPGVTSRASLQNTLSSLMLGAPLKGLAITNGNQLVISMGPSLLLIDGGAIKDDEIFHVFLPDNQYAEFGVQGWRIGPSDRLWS